MSSRDGEVSFQAELMDGDGVVFPFMATGKEKDQPKLELAHKDFLENNKALSTDAPYWLIVAGLTMHSDG